MKDDRKRNFTLTLILFALSVLLIVLELMPGGAMLRFGSPEGDPTVQTYVYFSLIPYGYANFGPFWTAILSCALLVLECIALFTKSKQLFAPITVLSALALFCSLLPLFFGLGTWLGGIISLIILAKVIIAVCGWTSLKWMPQYRARKAEK